MSAFSLRTGTRDAEHDFAATLPFFTSRSIRPNPRFRQWLPEFIRQTESVSNTAGEWSCAQITKSTPSSVWKSASPWFSCSGSPVAVPDVLTASICSGSSPCPVPVCAATITISGFSFFLTLSTYSCTYGMRETNSIPLHRSGESQFFILGLVKPIIAILIPFLVCIR